MRKAIPNDPLVKVRFDVRIGALATEVLQVQHYANHGNTAIEAIYTFPVPLHATLLGATVITEGRELSLRVKGAGRAERDYEEALSDGKAAYRVEQTRPGLYTLSAGNLAAGQQAELHLRWGLLNRWHGDRLALRLPTTLTERYGDAAAAGLGDETVPHTSILLDRRCDVRVTLDNSLSDCRWECASHPLQTEHGDGDLRLTGSNIAMDRDIVVVLFRRDQRNHLVTLADGDDWLAIAQVRSTEQRSGSLRDLVLVMDCSGSMAGASMQQARAGAMALLDWLVPTQKVNLIRFGSSHEALFEQLRAADEDTLGALQGCILRTDANMGGTNMATAVAEAVAQTQRSGRGADILLLTDGALWETEKVLRQVTGDVRVFTIGVGFAANDELVTRLATHGRGHCEVVSPGEDVADAVRRQYQRMASGEPMRLMASWPRGCEAWPAKAELYSGDAALLFASGPGSAPGSVRVTARSAHCGEQFSLLAEVNESFSADTLVRLAAAEQLRLIVNGAERREFAERYQLVCDETSLIVVDEAAEVNGTAEIVSVGHMTPGFEAHSEHNDYDRDLVCRAAMMLRSDAPDIPSLSSMRYSMALCSDPFFVTPEFDADTFVRHCDCVISREGLHALRIEMLADAGMSDSLILKAIDLAKRYPAHEVICALLIALLRQNPELSMNSHLPEDSLDDALLAATLRLVRLQEALT